MGGERGKKAVGAERNRECAATQSCRHDPVAFAGRAYVKRRNGEFPGVQRRAVIDVAVAGSGDAQGCSRELLAAIGLADALDAWIGPDRVIGKRSGDGTHHGAMFKQDAALVGCDRLRRQRSGRVCYQRSARLAKTSALPDKSLPKKERKARMPNFIRKRRTLYSTHHGTSRLNPSGRSSDSRLILLTWPSHLITGSGIHTGFRHRLQRRVRAGISPASLLSPNGAPTQSLPHES